MVDRAAERRERVAAARERAAHRVVGVPGREREPLQVHRDGRPDDRGAHEERPCGSRCPPPSARERRATSASVALATVCPLRHGRITTRARRAIEASDAVELVSRAPAGPRGHRARRRAQRPLRRVEEPLRAELPLDRPLEAGTARASAARSRARPRGRRTARSTPARGANSRSATNTSAGPHRLHDPAPVRRAARTAARSWRGGRTGTRRCRRAARRSRAGITPRASHPCGTGHDEARALDGPQRAPPGALGASGLRRRHRRRTPRSASG